MRAQKLKRGWIVAVASTSIAALSHSLAGGSYPPLILWALCTSLAALICVSLAGRKMPRLALATSVTFAQGIFHLLYSQAGAVVLNQEADGVHLHHAHIAGVATVHQHGENPLMLALHALASLATYVLIRQADGIVAGIKALAENPWRRVFSLAQLPVVPQRVAVLTNQFVPVLKGQILRFSGLLRGPPVAVTL